MNPAYEPYEKIDRYLNHLMGEEERSSFDKQLLVDAELRDLLEAQRLANELIFDDKLIKLKDRMRTDMNGNSGSFFQVRYFLSVALMLISAGIVYWFVQGNSPLDDASQVVVSPSENRISRSSSSRILPKDIASGTPKLKTTVSEYRTPNQSKQLEFVSIELAKEARVESSENAFNSDEIPKEERRLNQEEDRINCSDAHITAKARIDYSYKQEDAALIVDPKSITGGRAPYQYSLDKVSFTSDYRFDNLNEGSYQLYIRDQYNCVVELEERFEVKFPEKMMEESFNPSLGERWKFPLNGQSDGFITIQNKAGQVVYSKNIHTGLPEEWDGLDNNGHELSSGNYIFMINFTEQKEIKGTISIFR